MADRLWTASLPCLSVSFFFCDGHFGSNHFWLEPFPSKACADWVSVTSGRLIRWERARREHGERSVANGCGVGGTVLSRTLKRLPWPSCCVRQSSCLFPLTQQNLWLRPEHDVKLFGRVATPAKVVFSLCIQTQRLFDQARVIAVREVRGLDGYGEVSLCIISPFIHMVMNFANGIISPSARRTSC